MASWPTTSQAFWITAALFGFASILPIWRQGSVRDMNFWQYLSYVNQEGYEPFGHPHIPYEEAVARAHEAWEEING